MARETLSSLWIHGICRRESLGQGTPKLPVGFPLKPPNTRKRRRKKPHPCICFPLGCKSLLSFISSVNHYSVSSATCLLVTPGLGHLYPAVRSLGACSALGRAVDPSEGGRDSSPRRFTGVLAFTCFIDQKGLCIG